MLVSSVILPGSLDEVPQFGMSFGKKKITAGCGRGFRTNEFRTEHSKDGTMTCAQPIAYRLVWP